MDNSSALNHTDNKQPDDFFDIRIFFSKTGRAKYISHLDLYRTFQRAIKRAKLSVWETKGFNKHIYLTFPLPLALGIEGIHESVDMRLISKLSFDDVAESLNFALPDEIKILSVSRPQMKNNDIMKSKYELTTDLDINKFIEFLNQDKIETEKKTKKRGITIIDLKPFIELDKYKIILPKEGEPKKNNDYRISLILPSGNDFNINPFLVHEAYKKYNPLDDDHSFSVVRTAIYNKNYEIFI